MADSGPSPRLAWIAIGAGVLLYLAYEVRAALVPFLLSFALAYLANPLIALFETRGLRRDHGVLALYTVIASAISLAANSVLPAIASELALLQTQVPMYLRLAQDHLVHIQSQVAHRLPYGRSLVEGYSLRMYEPLMGHLQHLPGYLLSLVPLLSLLFLVPFITFYILMDTSRLIQRAIQACPSRYVEQALHLVCEIDESLGNYLRGIVIEGLAIASVAFAGLTLLGVDYALAIATLSGLVSFVPYAGPALGMTVGGLVAGFQYKSIAAGLKVAALFAGIRLADDLFLQPVISRHSVHLHPLAYLLALMIGAETFGFAGLLFAVPAACVLKVLGTLVWDWYLSGASDRLYAAPQARIPYT